MLVTFKVKTHGGAMRFVRDPTSQEQAELERMTRQEIGRVAMRAQMIRLSARKYSAPDIADILNTSRVTVYTWLDRFDAEGPAGLYDRPRSGRPPDVDETAQRCLETALDQTPEDYGYTATIWTTQLLQDLLHRRCAVSRVPIPSGARCMPWATAGGALAGPLSARIPRLLIG